MPAQNSENKKSPLLTIGITCFNAQDTIGRAVTSALQQDWHNKEIIIVDDASTDSSWDILQTIQREHPNLRLLRHESNKGLAGALNTIIEQTTGEFIAFFDDDNYSMPDRLRTQLERLTSYELSHQRDKVFCYGNRNRPATGETAQHRVEYAIGRRSPEPYGAAVADYLFGLSEKAPYVWGVLGTGILMARPAVLRTLGLFDEAFRRSEDLDMAIRAAFSGAHFIAVDRPIITKYDTTGADKQPKIRLRFSLLLREKYKDYLRQKRSYSASRLLARYHYERARGRKWWARCYLVLACAASWRVLISTIKHKATFVLLGTRLISTQ